MSITVDSCSRGFVQAIDPNRYPQGKPVVDPMESYFQVTQLVPQHSRVLDVGCGSGSLALYIQSARDAEVVGIEPHPERAFEARKQGLEVIEDSLNENLVSNLKQFDVVIFADVLEHLSDPYQAITIAKKVLKQGGYLIASVPNVAHWSVRSNLLWGRFDYEPTGIMDATHLRWFTKKSLVNLISSAGLELMSIQATAGKWMKCYRCCIPWRWMNSGFRNRVVDTITERWPTMFGCQFVLLANNQDHIQC